MLVHAYSLLQPHNDNNQSAYSSASTSAYIPDIPFDSNLAPAPAVAHSSSPNSTITAHRHLRRQLTAPYSTLPIQDNANQHSIPIPTTMHDTQSYIPHSVQHTLHAPQPVTYYHNPLQHFSELTVYASQPSQAPNNATTSWQPSSWTANGRVVRVIPTVACASGSNGSASYGTIEMYELTAKPAASSVSQSPAVPSSASMHPFSVMGDYVMNITCSSSSPATTAPLSATETTPSPSYNFLPDVTPMSPSELGVHNNSQLAVPSSPQPHMANMVYPITFTPPMFPPIPSTLPTSHYTQFKAPPYSGAGAVQASGSSALLNSDANAKDVNSELQQVTTSSGKFPPPQHTFSTPSELLGKLAAQDASDAREQRRKCRRKAKHEEAARTLGYIPTNPDDISTHDKKRFYLDCVEQYVIYLHEQLRQEKIEPVPVERVSSGRGLSSRSIRTMIVHLQRTIQRLHDQEKQAEERYHENRARLGVGTDFLKAKDDSESSSDSAPILGRKYAISYFTTPQSNTFPKSPQL